MKKILLATLWGVATAGGAQSPSPSGEALPLVAITQVLLRGLKSMSMMLLRYCKQTTNRSIMLAFMQVNCVLLPIT